MDLSKLRADLDEANQLIAASDKETADLQLKLTSAASENANLTKQIADLTGSHAAALGEKDAEIKRLELAEASAKGQVELLAKQVADLQATAKTASVQAAEITRSNAVEPFDNTTDGARHTISGKPDTTGLKGRDKAAAAFNHQFKTTE